MTQYANYPSLKDRPVLITGGASGIGAAIVAQFLTQGSRVTFIDIDEYAAKDLLETLKSQDMPQPLFIPCDLRDIAAIKKAVTQAEAAMGGIKVLINNAANDERHDTLEVTEQAWRRIMSVNLDHQFFTAQSVIPAMRKQQGGAIINLSSNCFILAQNSDYIGYMTAKSGIIGLTRGLAREFGVDNIRVNAILPGWVMTQKQLDKWLTEEAEIELLATQALKQKLFPDDIARMTLFLAADDSHMCTKQCFIVDAGRS